MPHLRKDSLTDRWVIIAEGRADKPDEFRGDAFSTAGGHCPFCPGREHQTPPPIASYHLRGESAWQVRVVPNRYPALELPCPPPDGHALCKTLPGEGVHEIIVESREHLASFSQVSDAQARLTFGAFRDRLRALSCDERLVCALVFKNNGAAAGASIVHTHSQLLAMPLIPPLLQQELDHSEAYHRATGRCPFCAMLDNELAASDLADGGRVVAQTSHFVAFCPCAGRFAYETWVLPRRHAARFEQIEEAQLGELSRFVRQTIGQIETATGRAEYNYLIHSAPFDTSAWEHYHWHIEIFPRLTGIAGYELGTGCFVNPVAPEAAADKLRNIAAQR